MSELLFSKVMAIFENDDRFKAVERERDRRDLIETYLEELSEKVYYTVAFLSILTHHKISSTLLLVYSSRTI